MKNKKLMFYDIEIFKDDMLLTFEDEEMQEVIRIWTDRSNPVRFSAASIHQLSDIINKYRLVGYNNYRYDDLLLTLVLRGDHQVFIKSQSDIIITSKDRYKGISVDSRIDSLDCSQAIVPGPTPVGLKRLEAGMGSSIVESSVPFDIDRPLIDSERKETEYYCQSDVEATIAAYHLPERKAYFESKKIIVEMIDHDDGYRVQRWNHKTSGFAKIITDKPVPVWSNYRLPKHAQHVPAVPSEVYEMWDTYDGVMKVTKSDKAEYTDRKWDCDVRWALGGLHGDAGTGIYEDVKDMDVASMYPHIITSLGILGQATATYNALIERRLQAKYAGEKPLSNALKVGINGTYGQMLADYGNLRNPMAGRTVCIYGQISITDLAERLYTAGCRIVQVNTDGVMVQDNGIDVYPIMHVWEQDYGLTMEVEHFSRIIQKDVNNYIAEHDDGSLTVKGTDVSKYNELNPVKKVTAAIVDYAIVEYLTHGTPVLETVSARLDDPMMYMIVCQAGETYVGTCDENGMMYQKVNRVYPAKTGVRLFKLRPDGGRVNYPDMPACVQVHNEACSEIKNMSDWLDISYYVKLTEKRLKSWPKKTDSYKTLL